MGFLDTLKISLDGARIKRAIENSGYLGDDANFERRKAFDFFTHRSFSFLPVQVAILATFIQGFFIIEHTKLFAALFAMEITEITTFWFVGKAILAYEAGDFEVQKWRRTTTAIEVFGLASLIGIFSFAMYFAQGINVFIITFTWLIITFFVIFVTTRRTSWLAFIVLAHTFGATIMTFVKLEDSGFFTLDLPPQTLFIPFTLFALICLASAHLLINYTGLSIENERTASIKHGEIQKQRLLLANEKKLLSTIQDHLSEAVIMTDEKGQILEHNAAFKTITDNQQYQNLCDLLAPDLRQLDRKWRIFKYGENQTLMVEGMALDLGPDHPNHLYFISDITDKVAADERNMQMQKINTLGTLTSGIAHDFNNYLSVIQANTELLIKMASNRKAPHAESELLENILAACLSSAGQTRRLLRFTRKVPERPEYISAKLACQRAFAIARGTLSPLYKLHINFELQASIFIDLNYFETAILNIFINARDAMPSGGHISFVAAERAGMIDISISDNGPGIPKEILGRVIEPFFSTKLDYAGSGIGLSNVLQFTEQSNGELKINSEPGKGTTVTITLPIASSHLVKADALETTEAAEIPAGSNKIILVDDNRPFARSLKMLLDSRGSDTIVANDVSKFRKIYQETAADLIICDVVLENENGLDVYDHTRSANGKQPILFISGNLPKFFQDKIETTENTWFLEKPFEAGQLIRLVKEILGDTGRRDTRATAQQA